jgi:HlyD family secretion protein
VVQLDDAEQKARLAEIDGQISMAKVALERAKVNYARVKKLRLTQNETVEKEDETRLAVDSAEAQIRQLDGLRATAQVYLEWTVIKSPIDGVVLAKLADPGELVSPQSFGGSGGPSTALLSMADPQDLQVEIDVSERDLSKISMNQRCRVSPEAFGDKIYAGHVAEIAPEANRQKGTLQIKVQIENPDHFLTPELNAKVEFLQEGPGQQAKPESKPAEPPKSAATQ